MSREVTTRANALIEASYRFELLEMQILLYGVSLINPVSKEFPTEYTIEIKRFAEIFNKDLKFVYRELKKAITGSFWERDVKYSIDNGKEVKHRWLTSVEYGDKQGYLKVFFNPKLQPYLHLLSKNFTVYYIDQIAKFKSIFSVRFYEFSIMHINKHKLNNCVFVYNVQEIKKKLDISDKYIGRYDNFKRQVLNKAKQEINQHSDLTLDFEEIKQGRTVKSIKFIIQRKEGTKPAKYVKEKQQELDFDTTGDEGLNTDTSPLSDTELHYLMRKNDIKVRMFSYRVAETVACKLIKDYDFERIENALNYMDNAINKGKDIKNKPAYLVNAIKEGY